jgi:hypothetical protein
VLPQQFGALYLFTEQGMWEVNRDRKQSANRHIGDNFGLFGVGLIRVRRLDPTGISLARRFCYGIQSPLRGRVCDLPVTGTGRNQHIWRVIEVNSVLVGVASNALLST